MDNLGEETALVTLAKTELRIESDGHVTGNTGCNRFTGSATVDGTALSFSPLATTRAGCEAPVMEVETAMLKALEATKSYTIEGKYLALFDGEGHPILKMVRAKGRP